MGKVNDITATLVIFEAKRVIELLEDPHTDYTDPYWNAKLSELKCKMRELRRDTMRLEKEIRGEY